jgi:hypothetical protein
MRKRVSDAYKAIASQRAYPALTATTDFFMDSAGTVFVDCETASYATPGPTHASADHQAKRIGSNDSKRIYLPILYSAWDKSDQSDDLLICFGALGIAQTTGTAIPPKRKVV